MLFVKKIFSTRDLEIPETSLEFQERFRSRFDLAVRVRAQHCFGRFQRHSGKNPRRLEPALLRPEDVGRDLASQDDFCGLEQNRPQPSSFRWRSRPLFSAVIFLSATWILREKINGCRFST